MARLRLILAGSGLWALAFGWLSAQGSGQIETSFFDGTNHPVIAYNQRQRQDSVARLKGMVEAGQTALAYEPVSGYLRALLRALDIGVDTQLAVFSKTSLQAPIINPANPRTIFFNDSVVVAWPRGGLIELAAQDPELGVAFYTIDQRRGAPLRVIRESGCLNCHVSYATLNVPGLLVRSVATAPNGASLPFLANATPDHRTPFEERWAGWFVTGSASGLRHLGNATVADARLPTAAAIPAGSTLATLEGRFEPTGYLSGHSDVAAHLVFTHQMHMMNLITRIGWQTRIARADQGPAAARAAATSLAVDFVDYLLFVDEPPLPAPVSGGSGFAERFSALGPRDQRGRSLRELDLRTRVLKYPCSYLIYSEAFDAMPSEAREAIYARLSTVLAGTDASPRYRHLSPGDRAAIVEILRDTKSDLPESFGKP